MISVRVLNRKASAIPRWPITSGSVGLPVEFIFSSEWDELTKTAIFRGSDVAIDVVLTDDTCVVPWEALAVAGGDLYIGVYGSNGEDVVIPTVWCNAGYIEEGAMRSEVDPADPTPSWADQVQAIAQQALDLAQSATGAVYPVTYDETTYSQVETAIESGKTPKLIYNNRWYELQDTGMDSFTFTCIGKTGILYWARLSKYSIIPAATAWTSGSVELAASSIVIPDEPIDVN